MIRILFTLLFVSFVILHESFAQLPTDSELKLEAARRAGIDTLPAFRQQAEALRSRTIRRALFADNVSLKRAYQRQLKEGRMARAVVRQLFRPLPQNITNSHLEQEVAWMDSIHWVLQADTTRFASLVQRFSEEKQPQLIRRWSTTLEFEQQVDSLQAGEISSPFFSPQGLHIVQVIQPWYQQSYEQAEADLIARYRFSENAETEKLMHRYRQLRNGDTAFASRLQQQQDSLLADAITRQVLAERYHPDEATLQTYFAQHQSRYKWEEPHFKGMALCCANKKTYKMVRKFFKKLPEAEWASAIRMVVEKDSLTRVVASPASYAPGENPYMDEKAFGGTKVPVDAAHPYLFVVGRKQKMPESYKEVEHTLLADYRKGLEKEWLNELRRAEKGPLGNKNR